MTQETREPWLFVIGIGEDGTAGLTDTVRRLIESADALIGGERQLALVGETKAERLSWAKPFSDNVPLLRSRQGKRVCLLASGDPFWFGAAGTLIRHFDPAEVAVYPHPGSFSLAAARLHWPLQECVCLSAHGRSAAGLRLHFSQGARLLVLSRDGETPSCIAAMLCEKGFGASAVTVLECLEGPKERRIEQRADAMGSAVFDPLNIVAVECRSERFGWRGDSRVPGLPDEAFESDGLLTKREVRAVTLAALGPTPGALLWDIGAGCGSIAIEWTRAGGTAVALERDTERCAKIARNAEALGVPDLTVVQGEAPGALNTLPGVPSVIFLGGAVSAPGLLETAWACLPAGGRLVANAVTLESESALVRWQEEHGGTLSRLSVERLDRIGRSRRWRALAPVVQYCGEKDAS